MTTESPRRNSACSEGGVNRRIPIFALGLLSVALVFHRTLWEIARLSWNSSLYSHLVLMPLVSAYLVYLRKKSLPATARPPILITAVLFLAAAAGVLIARYSPGLEPRAGLAFCAFGMVMCALGVTAACWGAAIFRALAVPATLLLFMIPMPESVESMAAEGLQFASATAAQWFFSLAGAPVYRDGLIFQLPGLTILVAEECSGIRSTLILLISSIVAADVFLRTSWKKWLLVGLVIPLGILRNGFRIVSISLLTIHVDPEIIHGPLHRKGGPIFFMLSLAILLIILLLLRRTENKIVDPKAPGGAT